MLATNGPQWFDRRRPENTWPSIVVSVGITAALFVSAFLAMQTVGRWSGTRSQPLEPTVVVHLTPPPPVERPRPTPKPTPATPRELTAPATVPVGVPTTATPSTSATPLTTPPPATRADTAGARAKSNTDIPAIPLGPIAPPRIPADSGILLPSAPNSTSGVTIGSRVPNSAAYRDSVMSLRLKGVPFLATTHAPTGENLQALRSSQQNAARVAARTTTAGNANVHVMQGEGVDGVGAVGGGAGVPGNALGLGHSIGLPLLSKGPSAAQRKKNELLEADYRAGLSRLQDRILLRRDSLRLDSLRRDSLAKRRP